MLTKRKWMFMLVVTSMLILIVGAFGTQAQDDAESNVLQVGMPQPLTLDPALGTNDHEVIISRHIYDYLVELRPNGELVPSLAEEWEISDDGLTYTFELVENATFHDGSDFTSADVVYTFDRLADVGSSAMGLLGQNVVGEDDEGNAITEAAFTVEARDDYEVVFTLDQPNADFLFGVASRFSAILPAGLETPNSIEEGVETFNGTGPFQLASADDFDAGERLILTTNDNYWGDVPALDAIEFIFIGDPSTQVDALRSGQVDFIMRIPDDLLPNLQGEDGITVTSVASNGHPAIRLRSDAGHLGEDVRVRQAFKHATDRELLNLDVLDGLGTVGNNDPIGPVYGPLYTPAETLAYNPQRACDLLAEYAAETPDNPWVTLDGDTPTLEIDFYVVDALGYPLLAEFMQQQWQNGCIDVNLIVRQETIYYGEGEWLEVDLGLTGWGSRPTPQEYLNVAYTTGAPFNEAHWSNEEINRLSAEASQTADTEERKALYAEIGEIFVEEGPVIIPFFRPFHGAYTSEVSGLEMHSFPGRTDLDSVTLGEGM